MTGDPAPLVADLLALSAHDAPSADPAASAGAVEWLKGRLGRLGAEVIAHNVATGVVLEGRIGRGGGAPVLILCHYDTVWPAGTAAERPAREDGGVVHGPGVFDMRGGIVAALAAVERSAPVERPVRILLTPDEETGSGGSSPLILAAARTAAVVLVTEPPMAGGALKTSRKGWAGYSLRVSGRAAHAGLEPEAGASAVHALVDQLQRARELARPELGTTLNVGVVGGGSAANVVADSAWADIDVRAVAEAEQRRVHSALEGLAGNRQGISISLETTVMRPPMERTPVIAAAFERARAIAAELGVELEEAAAGGASDGNLVAPLGVPVLDGLGPEGAGAHGPDERVVARSLAERCVLIGRLIERW